MLRDSLTAWVIALPAAMMLATGSASALPMMALCSGGSAQLPGQDGQQDCDKACHAGCQRRRGKG